LKEEVISESWKTKYGKTILFGEKGEKIEEKYYERDEEIDKVT